MSAASAREVMLDRLAELEREMHALRRFLGAEGTGAASPADAVPQAREEELLLCYAGMRAVAVELAAVSEVLPAASLMELPESSDFVLGALNVRGAPLVVHDLAHRLCGDRSPLSRTDLILDCEHAGRRLGLKINDALDVVRAVVTPVLEEPDESLDARLLRGAIVHGGEQVVVLDLAAFAGHGPTAKGAG